MVTEEKRPKNYGRIILRKKLPEYTGYSVVHCYRLIKAGCMPKPVRLGRNRVGWLESELAEWLAAKVAQRDKAGEHAV